MLNNEQLKDALNSVITIPLIPFRNGLIDYDAHARNIRYLMDNNHLSGNRPRVICVAGTSLIHHVSTDDQNRLMEVTGKVMGSAGILISAIAPNPIDSASELIRTQAAMQRVPDAYLIMPLGGTYSLEGLYGTFREFAEQNGKLHNARFLYYYRQPRDRDAIIRLVNDCEYFIGVKIGTVEEDVPVFTEALGNRGMVIWGVGDRSTRAAELGALGHTSGISVLFSRAGDEINNAQRRGDYVASRQMENRITPLEEIRFENGRVYNYAAVVEGMIQSGFDDIDAGEGGPFNPRVPAEVAARIQSAIEKNLDLH